MGKYTKGGGTKGPNSALVMGVAIAVFGGLGGGYAMLSRQASANATDANSGCLTKKDAPEAMLVLVDETDKLSKENAERIRQHMLDQVNRLPRYSRVLIVPFGGDIATPLHPIFDHCVPGKGEDGGVTEGAQVLQVKYDQFEKALNGLVESLQTIPDSKTSPITGQIVRAASDEVLHWQGQAKSLILVTDGLESSVYWTKELQLQKPVPGLLQGVKVEYFEVGNAKGARFQNPALRKAWKVWLEGAGGEVRMVAPGYPAG